MKKRISIFASGSGSNAQKFFEYFDQHESIEIASVFTNNRSAGVIERAQKFRIPVHVYNRSYWVEGTTPISILQEEKVDYIVLAGFMLLIPKSSSISSSPFAFFPQFGQEHQISYGI